MRTFGIPEEFLKAVISQAQKEYPKECCGMILGRKDREREYTRVWPCRNVQDEYHVQDAGRFPRDSRDAYFIDPKELLQIQRALHISKEVIRIIYHSHIDTGAYFSEEDKRMACWNGRPVYPGVDYLVVSVIAGSVKEMNLFGWDSFSRSFSARDNSAA